MNARLESARSWFLRHGWRTAAGALAGAALGGGYAYFVGCHTGTCPLTSSVWTAALFFGFTGAIVGGPGPAKPRDRRA